MMDGCYFPEIELRGGGARSPTRRAPPSLGADEGQGVEGGAPWEKPESVNVQSSTKPGPWTLDSAVH